MAQCGILWYLNLLSQEPSMHWNFCVFSNQQNKLETSKEAAKRKSNFFGGQSTFPDLVVKRTARKKRKKCIYTYFEKFFFSEWITPYPLSPSLLVDCPLKQRTFLQLPNSPLNMHKTHRNNLRVLLFEQVVRVSDQPGSYYPNSS